MFTNLAIELGHHYVVTFMESNGDDINGDDNP